MHAVIETSVFSRRADALLSPADRDAMIAALARDPQAGDLVQGLGGVRKLRFAPKGRGKSGAFRVIYYVLNRNMPILALMICAKNEQADIGPAQRKVMLGLIELMKRQR